MGLLTVMYVYASQAAKPQEEYSLATTNKS